MMAIDQYHLDEAIRLQSRMYWIHVNMTNALNNLNYLGKNYYNYVGLMDVICNMQERKARLYKRMCYYMELSQ